ncbi:MAG: dehydrogenase [Pseudomonadota bacterium]
MEIPEALTFDDVLLEPRHSSVLPKETIVSTKLSTTVTLGIPLIASAMDTVSEYKLAIAMAQSGGMACIHKNMSVEDQVNQIKLVLKDLSQEWLLIQLRLMLKRHCLRRQS